MKTYHDMAWSESLAGLMRTLEAIEILYAPLKSQPPWKDGVWQRGAPAGAADLREKAYGYLRKLTAAVDEVGTTPAAPADRWPVFAEQPSVEEMQER
jgi:hypothetical protein